MGPISRSPWSARIGFGVLRFYGKRFGGGGGRNSTLSFKCDDAGLPPDRPGTNSHKLRARSASRCSARGPDNTVVAATYPFSLIVTSIVTTPSSSMSLAQGGKVGCGCDTTLAGIISPEDNPPWFWPLEEAASVAAVASRRFVAVRVSA